MLQLQQLNTQNGREHTAATTAATGLQADCKLNSVVWACKTWWRRERVHKHFRLLSKWLAEWAKLAGCGEGECKQAMLFITNITSQTPWAYLGSMFANKCSDARVRHCKKKVHSGYHLFGYPALHRLFSILSQVLQILHRYSSNEYYRILI